MEIRDILLPTENRPNDRLILKYALLGPLIGAVLIICLFYLYVFAEELASGGELGDLFGDPPSLSDLLLFLGLVVFYGYILGGMQAIATGVLLKLWTRNRGEFTYLMAAGAAALIGLIALFFLLIIFNSSPTGGAWIALILCAVGVAASLGLRFIFRKSFSGPRASLTP